MWGAGFLRGLIHLIDEGLAVGTLDLGRVGFMGAHLNLVQSTGILCLGVMGAVIDGTSDGFILVGHLKNSSFSVR